MSETQLAKQAARGAAISLASQGGRFLIQLISLAILSRLLSPSDFGTIEMVTAVVGIGTLLGDFGLSLATVSEREMSGVQRSNLFWFNTVVGIVVASAVVLLADPIASLYHRPALYHVCQVLSSIFFLQAVSAQLRANTARLLKYGILAVTDLSANLAGAVVAILIAWDGGGYWSLVSQQIIVSLITLIMLALAGGWIPSRPRRDSQTRRHLSFGFSAGGVQMLVYLTSNFDSVIIGRYLGSSALGIYNQAYNVFGLPVQQLASPMTMVALPVLARTKSDEEYEQYILRAQTVLMYVLGISFGWSAGLAYPLFDVVLGRKWHDSATVFILLAVGGLFVSIGYVTYWICLSRNLTNLQMKYASISRIAIVAFLIIGLHWGVRGVAAGQSAGAAVNWFLITAVVLPKSGLSVAHLLRRVVWPVVVSLTIFTCCFSTDILLEHRLSEVLLLALLLVMGIVLIVVFPLLSSTIRCDYNDIWDVACRVLGRRLGRTAIV